MKDFSYDAYLINCPTQARGLGINATGYPGAFTGVVNMLIEAVVCGIRHRYTGGRAPRVLHLFSGVSNIGDVRVDLKRPEATTNKEVGAFLLEHDQHYDLTLLDPPYGNIRVKGKLDAWAKTSSVAADVRLRRIMAAWFKKHTDHILWLDACAPLPAGFERTKVWFLLPGGYRTVRVLSWLTRKGIKNDHTRKSRSNKAAKS